MDGLQPETIVDQPIPLLGVGITLATGSNSSGGENTPRVIQDTDIPISQPAIDVINETINTQTRRIKGVYSFEQLGAFQIGDFTDGVSGDIIISRDGIVAQNINGSTTFALDGTTGSATFSGSIAAGSIFTGSVNVGNGNVIIDGANARILIADGTYDRILIGFQSGGF